VEVTTAGDIVIGRAAGTTVELPFPRVSARHARIFREGGGYCVEDLGSSNGTWLGERRLRAHVPEPFAVDDRLAVGGVELRFLGEKPEGGGFAPGAGPDTLARRLVHDLFESCPPAESVRLLVLSGPKQGTLLRLTTTGRSYKIGRGEGCDLLLPDEDVSRVHAAIERSAQGTKVRDLGSKNGVAVGDERVAGERLLRDGDILRMGETTLRLVDPEDRYLRQMEEAEGEVAADGAAAEVGAGVRSDSDPPVASTGQPEPPDLGGTSRLPAVASAIAVTVLLLTLGVVLALAFGLHL
jgi:pSer/pThr/pTyr-binding forkhead associated (FHA) protein